MSSHGMISTAASGWWSIIGSPSSCQAFGIDAQRALFDLVVSSLTFSRIVACLKCPCFSPFFAATSPSVCALHFAIKPRSTTQHHITLEEGVEPSNSSSSTNDRPLPLPSTPYIYKVCVRERHTHPQRRESKERRAGGGKHSQRLASTTGTETETGATARD